MGKRRGEYERGTAVQLPLFGPPYVGESIEEVALPRPSTGLREASVWFRMRLASLEYSANTVESYATSVDSLARFLGDDYPLRRVSPRQLRRYLHWLAHRDGSAPVKTLALRVTGLRKFFQMLLEAGVLKSNPAEDLYAPPGTVPLPDVLSEDEEAAVREVAWSLYQEDKRRGTQPLLVMILALDLALRRGELEDLTIGQVETSTEQVQVRIRYTRRCHRYKNRVLVAPPYFRDVYRDYLRQYPSEDGKVLTASRRTLHRIVARLGKWAGVSVHITPRVMRWTCALRWYQELPPEEVRYRLGLSPIGWQDAEEVLVSLLQRGKAERH